jgi:sphingolipid 4-desaturase/C4-monooxygenase
MVTDAVAWHDRRRASIRKAHPEVQGLYGHDSSTQALIVVLVAAHFAVARWLARASLGPWFAATLIVGPTLAHAIGVLVHETAHNLVAKGTRANKAWSLFLNLPLGAPAVIVFRAQHALHHRHLADADPNRGQDTQAPTPAEDAWAGTSSLRKLFSFTFGRYFWKTRPANKVSLDAWMAANWVTTLGALGLVFTQWGAAAALYLVCSSLLAFGPHPFGARRLSEHLPVRTSQPTNSYYGPLNALSFNVGYHVEHHDFPNVPWTRLKKLRALAHTAYDDLFSFTSWTRLILAYVLDARYRVRHYVGLGSALGEEATRSSAHPPHGNSGHLTR